MKDIIQKPLYLFNINPFRGNSVICTRKRLLFNTLPRIVYIIVNVVVVNSMYILVEYEISHQVPYLLYLSVP